uniref:hypothetical protein n=1 Tax=Microbacterium sp. B19 TaxID=96765 RepID=UPI0003B76F7D
MTGEKLVPEPPANAEHVRQATEALRHRADHFELTLQEALLTWNLVPQLYRAPEADVLHQSLTSTRPVGREVAAGLEAACRALERYADDLDDLAYARGLILNAQASGAPTSAWEDDDADRGATMNGLARRRWQEALRRDAAALAERYDEATERCARALRAIPDVSWTSLVAWASPEVTDSPASPTDTVGRAILDRLTLAPDPADLLSRHPEWSVILGRTAPDEIAKWWSGLDPRVVGALVMALPAVIGNLDGVPIAERVAVNRGRASDHLRQLRAERQALEALRAPRSRANALEVLDRRAERARLDREIAYFEDVANGRKQLYAWDPEHGSLTEMAGDPSTAKAALFVLPGTNAKPEAFMSERPLTDFAEWQVGSGGGSVVAFTVLTGPMPQLDDLVTAGPEWNRFAEQRGGEYARFLQGVDATHPDLWTMSYEHSYGGGVGSEAEKHGGTVDARFLAASVGAIGPYEPHPGTQYFATQAIDDINRYYAGVGLGPLGFTVAPETIPGVHIVDSGLPAPNIPQLVDLGMTRDPGVLVSIVRTSVQHHTALMSSDESINGPVWTRSL